VPCQIVRERDFRLVSTLTLDLSEAGLAARAERPVLTGEPLIVSMRVPFSHVWLDAEAVVVRVLHGRRSHDRGASLGIAFTSVPDAAARALARELGWFKERAAAPRSPAHQSIGA
jgi:hypothetical protein